MPRKATTLPVNAPSTQAAGAADPGERFEFRTVSDRRNPLYHDSTTWSYVFRADGHGTRVAHSYRIDVLPYRPLLALYSRLHPQHQDMRPQMRQNLETLRRQAHAGRSSGSALPRTPVGQRLEGGDRQEFAGSDSDTRD